MSPSQALLGFRLAWLGLMHDVVTLALSSCVKWSSSHTCFEFPCEMALTRKTNGVSLQVATASDSYNLSTPLLL